MKNQQKKVIGEINGCKWELNNCLACSFETRLKQRLCTECNDDYYKIENEHTNETKYFSCYKEPKGYYLDKNNSLYKKCYNTCETCEIKGDYITHNCLTCNKNFSFNISINNYINCY